MFIASVCLSVCPSVCLSVCLKPKFGRFKTKFDDDAEGGPRSGPADPKDPQTRKTKFGPTFYVFYTFIASVCLSVCLKPKFVRLKPKFDEDAE